MMLTIEAAAERIAHAVLVATGNVHGRFHCAGSLDSIRESYIRSMLAAFEQGEMRLHSASSLLPLSPSAGVGVALLGGRVHVVEVNRWLGASGVPVSIDLSSVRAGRASDEHGETSSPGKSGEHVDDRFHRSKLVWHRDPYWREKIHRAADAYAKRNADRGYGGTSARSVMHSVHAAMSRYPDFPIVTAESIRKRVLNAQRKADLPGWTFTYDAPTARAVPVESADSRSHDGPPGPLGPDNRKET